MCFLLQSTFGVMLAKPFSMPRSDKYLVKCSSYSFRVLFFHFTFKSPWNSVVWVLVSVTLSLSLMLAVCPSVTLSECMEASYFSMPLVCLSCLVLLSFGHYFSHPGPKASHLLRTQLSKSVWDCFCLFWIDEQGNKGYKQIRNVNLISVSAGFNA